MTDPKPNLVKMAREALKPWSDPSDALGRYEALAHAVIDQLAPPPVRVARWVAINKNGDIVAWFKFEEEARKEADRWNASPQNYPNGPYRVIFVTGEEGVGPND